MKSGKLFKMKIIHRNTAKMSSIISKDWITKLQGKVNMVHIREYGFMEYINPSCYVHLNDSNTLRLRNNNIHVGNVINWIDYILNKNNLDGVYVKFLGAINGPPRGFTDGYEALCFLMSPQSIDESSPTSSIIIREWIDEMDIFSCYVKNKTLRGVSCVNKNIIEKYNSKLEDLVSKISTIMNYNDFILDVTVKCNRIRVVEIRRYDIVDDIGNFSICDVFEKSILTGVEKNFDVLYKEDPLVFSPDCISLCI